MGKADNRNRGFTLIELVVAVAILALIAVPILHAFLSSAEMNGDSKSLMSATTAGQNVMERIKGTNMSKLIGASSEAVVNDLGDGMYELTFHDEQVSGQTYQVVAKLDPSEYRAASGEALDYNDMGQPAIYSIDSQYDGSYTPAAGIARANANLFHAADAYNEMTKTTTLDIQKAGKVGSTMISIVYDYDGAQKHEVKNSYIYRDALGTDAMRAMYIFFEPMYTAVSRNAKEKIVINNPDLAPVTVYLIKQDTAEKSDVNELNYAVEVVVNEPGRSKDWSLESDYVPVTTIRTNLESEQIQLSYAGAMGAMDADKMVALGDLAGNVVEDRIYKVEVSVYDKNGKEVVTIDGTKEK